MNDSKIDQNIKVILRNLEDYSYESKLNGLEVLDRLLDDVTSAELSVNNRSQLLYHTLNRYMHDKESKEFLCKLLDSMRRLLAMMETKYSKQEHNYKLHAIIFDSILDNCYMCTNPKIKLVYYSSIQDYLNQLNIYATRHLSKLFKVAFECIDHLQANMEFSGNFEILDSCFLIIEQTIEICKLRIHVHSKQIFNFFIKLLFYYSLDPEACLIDDNNFDVTKTNSEKSLFLKRVLHVITLLFNNEKVKENDYCEFIKLKDIETNKVFLSYIDYIIHTVDSK